MASTMVREKSTESGESISSDHSPLVFSSSFSDFGHTRPKLFRFFSSWARLPESHRIVAEAWSCLSVEAKDRICATLGWPCDALPASYLGLPLFAGKLKDVWCQPLINKVEKRLSLWKSATLSYVGRLCLLKHVLSSIIGFWTSVFTLPKKVSRLLAASMANFLWRGNENSKARHLIAWDQVCKPYSEGGVGLPHIEEWSKACHESSSRFDADEILATALGFPQ
ncbi:putative ribonuclease H protein [Nymphaea thermarum]|nr:putative ribonuclease H protein [Nymphaea thermarum]